jgi:hypothetical protein
MHAIMGLLSEVNIKITVILIVYISYFVALTLCYFICATHIGPVIL